MFTKRAMRDRPGTMHPGARATCPQPMMHDRAAAGPMQDAKGLRMVRLAVGKLGAAAPV